MTKYILKILFFLFLFQPLLGQKKNHEQQISTIFNLALTQGKSYDWLDYLSNQIGGRLSGSLNAERAVKWGEEALQGLLLCLFVFYLEKNYFYVVCNFKLQVSLISSLEK